MWTWSHLSPPPPPPPPPSPPPSPPLSVASAASWEVVDDSPDWDLVSCRSTSSMSFSASSTLASSTSASSTSASSISTSSFAPSPASTSAVTLDVLAAADAAAAAADADATDADADADAYDTAFPPMWLTRFTKQPKTRHPPTPGGDWAFALALAAASSLDGSTAASAPGPGPVTRAALGVGMRDTGPRCGLAVIRAHDVLLQPNGRHSAQHTPPRPRGRRGTTPCRSDLRNKHLLWKSTDIDLAPPKRGSKSSWDMCMYHRRGWRLAAQHMWDTLRDKRRFPRNLDWNVAGVLQHGRRFQQWSAWGSPSHARSMLYFKTGGPPEGQPLDVRLFKETATAIAMDIARRRVDGAVSFENGQQRYDWGYIRHRLLRPPLRRVEKKTAAGGNENDDNDNDDDTDSNINYRNDTQPVTPPTPSPYPVDEVAWLFTFVDPHVHVRHFVDSDFLLRAAELEVRARRLWVAARDSGELSEDWTPYGLFGETYPGSSDPVPRSLRGQYLQEPLPETLLVGLVDPSRRWYTLQDWCVTWGPEFWREVRSGPATARYCEIWKARNVATW